MAETHQIGAISSSGHRPMPSRRQCVYIQRQPEIPSSEPKGNQTTPTMRGFAMATTCIALILFQTYMHASGATGRKNLASILQGHSRIEIGRASCRERV